MFHAVV